MEKKEFQTTDLSLVSFLIYSGFKQSKLPTLEDRLSYFYFHKTPELEEAIRLFVNREAKVEPSGILEASRKVKALVWETRKPSNKGVQI